MLVLNVYIHPSVIAPIGIILGFALVRAIIDILP